MEFINPSLDTISTHSLDQGDLTHVTLCNFERHHLHSILIIKKFCCSNNYEIMT